MRELVVFAAILVGWAAAEALSSTLDRPGPRTLARATGLVLLAGHVAGVVEHVLRGVRWPYGLAAGCVLAAAGVALRIAAIVTLGREFASRLGAGRLVTAGPYRWMRHPSEAGLLLAAVGCALVLASWAALAAALVLVPLSLVRCSREDVALAADHPTAYRTWARDVGWFWPRLR